MRHKATTILLSALVAACKPAVPVGKPSLEIALVQHDLALVPAPRATVLNEHASELLAVIVPLPVTVCRGHEPCGRSRPSVVLHWQVQRKGGHCEVAAVLGSPVRTVARNERAARSCDEDSLVEALDQTLCELAGAAPVFRESAIYKAVNFDVGDCIARGAFVWAEQVLAAFLRTKLPADFSGGPAPFRTQADAILREGTHVLNVFLRAAKHHRLPWALDTLCRLGRIAEHQWRVFGEMVPVPASVAAFGEKGIKVFHEELEKRFGWHRASALKLYADCLRESTSRNHRSPYVNDAARRLRALSK